MVILSIRNVDTPKKKPGDSGSEKPNCSINVRNPGWISEKGAVTRNPKLVRVP